MINDLARVGVVIGGLEGDGRCGFNRDKWEDESLIGMEERAESDSYSRHGTTL